MLLIDKGGNAFLSHFSLNSTGYVWGTEDLFQPSPLFHLLFQLRNQFCCLVLLPRPQTPVGVDGCHSQIMCFDELLLLPENRGAAKKNVSLQQWFIPVVG